LAAEDATVHDLEEMGPVDYLIIEFPDGEPKGKAAPLLVDLVDRGLIRILDLMFIVKGEDGTVARYEIADFDGDGKLDFAVFEGASSGLLGDDDVAVAAAGIEPGSAAVMLVYENRWAAPFAAAVRRNGGELVAFQRIPVQDLIASHEAAEATA
jgi:hypothetical protein